MSQFLLAKSVNTALLPDWADIVPAGENEFLQGIAAAIFGTQGAEDVVTLFGGTDDFDGLFLRARAQMQSGIPFEETGLHVLLASLADLAETVVLWYGADYRSLDVAPDKAAFLDRVRQGLESPSSEAFVAYSATYGHRALISARTTE